MTLKEIHSFYPQLDNLVRAAKESLHLIPPSPEKEKLEAAAEAGSNVLINLLFSEWTEPGKNTEEDITALLDSVRKV